MLVEDATSALHAEHHERGGIGISCGTVVGQHRGREYVVLYRIACLGVNGVGIFLSALVIEIAIVTACGHGFVRDIQNGLQLIIHADGIIGGLGHPNAPGHPFVADALGHYLAPNLYHEVLDAVVLEQFSHHVAAITLGDGRAVEHDSRVLLLYRL